MRFLLAYVDPAAGATLMQLALAGTVGVAAVVKMKWQSIKSVFVRSEDTELVEGDQASPSDEEFPN